MDNRKHNGKQQAHKWDNTQTLACLLWLLTTDKNHQIISPYSYSHTDLECQMIKTLHTALSVSLHT